MPRTSDKRERLVKAGHALLHGKGFTRTTLSDVADVSGVPPGNIYYYFRSKEDLLEAVVLAQEDDFKWRAARFEKQATPQARLVAPLDSAIETRHSIARSGCPVGRLCQEMNEEDK